MPTMQITNVDGATVTIVTSDELQAEINRFDAAIDRLLPAMEGDDDTAGRQAVERYDILANWFEAIVDRLPGWNAALVEENREKRRALATKLRDRRRG